jgi:hypothetical protein
MNSIVNLGSPRNQNQTITTSKQLINITDK